MQPSGLEYAKHVIEAQVNTDYSHMQQPLDEDRIGQSQRIACSLAVLAMTLALGFQFILALEG